MNRFLLADCSHIVVAEDDMSLRQMVMHFLEDHNFRTKPASSRLSRHLVGPPPCLIILDLRLSKDDGLDLLREIRSHSDVPVIIMTGDCSDEIDLIVGLVLGADCYIVKPFSLRELLARVRAVLRSDEIARAPRAPDPERGLYRFGGWRLERRGRRLVDRNEVPVSLSKGEYALLLAFLEAPQRPLTREYLLQAMRIHEDVFDRSIDVQDLRLRRKLEIDPLRRNTLAQLALFCNFDTTTLALRSTREDVLRVPEVDRQLADEVSGFGVSYPEPLFPPDPGWEHRKGLSRQRLPDVELVLKDGSRTTFYRLLESGRWLRLRLTSNEAITSNAGAMTTVSLDPNVNNGLFANCGSVLVCPDGYLAHVCPEGDVQAV